MRKEATISTRTVFHERCMIHQRGADGHVARDTSGLLCLGMPCPFAVSCMPLVGYARTVKRPAMCDGKDDPHVAFGHACMHEADARHSSHTRSILLPSPIPRGTHRRSHHDGVSIVPWLFHLRGWLFHRPSPMFRFVSHGHCRGRVGDGWRPPRVRFSTTGWSSFHPSVLWMAQDWISLRGGERNERMTSDEVSFPATSPPGRNQLNPPPTPSWWNATPHA